jgi:hypothetical protein
MKLRSEYGYISIDEMGLGCGRNVIWGPKVILTVVDSLLTSRNIFNLGKY